MKPPQEPTPSVSSAATNERNEPAPLRDRPVVDPLRETLTLVYELSEALSGQLRRARRQASGQSIETGLGTLLDEAAVLERNAAALINAYEGQSTRPSATEAPATGRTAGAARSLAVDLRREGRTQEEVEQLLVESLHIDNAAAVVADVFADEAESDAG